MGRMHNPPYPGAILKGDVLPELGLSVSEAARQLGISRVQFSRMINGKAALTPDMALRQEVWLAGPTAETWLGMQMDYDLWHASRKPRPKIQRVAARGARRSVIRAVLGARCAVLNPKCSV